MVENLCSHRSGERLGTGNTNLRLSVEVCVPVPMCIHGERGTPPHAPTWDQL